MAGSYSMISGLQATDQWYFSLASTKNKRPGQQGFGNQVQLVEWNGWVQECFTCRFSTKMESATSA